MSNTIEKQVIADTLREALEADNLRAEIENLVRELTSTWRRIELKDES